MTEKENKRPKTVVRKTTNTNRRGKENPRYSDVKSGRSFFSKAVPKLDDQPSEANTENERLISETGCPKTATAGKRTTKNKIGKTGARNSEQRTFDKQRTSAQSTSRNKGDEENGQRNCLKPPESSLKHKQYLGCEMTEIAEVAGKLQFEIPNRIHLV